MIVYVNDIIVTGNDKGEIQRLKTYLSNIIWDQGSKESKIFSRDWSGTFKRGNTYFPIEIYSRFAKGDRDAKMQTNKDSDWTKS